MPLIVRCTTILHTSKKDKVLSVNRLIRYMPTTKMLKSEKDAVQYLVEVYF